MATRGVAWDCPQSDIMDALRRNNGVITYAAPELGVCRETLIDRCKTDPELKELLARLRNSHVKHKCAKAEKTVEAIMERWEVDASNALKASIFTLNNLGKELGYACNEERAAIATSCAADAANKSYKVAIAAKTSSED